MSDSEFTPPRVGMSVKLRHGMLGLSARWCQTVTDVKPLALEDGFTDDAEIEAEGNYWIKTSHTNGEWWAWCHFRVA